MAVKNLLENIYRYICIMAPGKIIVKDMWSRQKIKSLDIDYHVWKEKRESIQKLSRISQSCIFTVDVFKCRYDFASESFADIFGYNLSWIKNIEKQGDLLEERIHPDDRDKMIHNQIKHSQFIYSLPLEIRNNYRNSYQFRMLNAKGNYINVVSRQQVIETDRLGKAWIIMGIMDISPDQTPCDDIKYSTINIKTGEILSNPVVPQVETILTNREKQILHMICKGLLSKEIAYKLGLSIHTINNHRKNILSKLAVDNSIEAINYAKKIGLLD